jgi:hypothetical protein
MAKVHFRQALKLDPENPLALKYAEQVNLTVNGAQPAPKPTEPQQKRNGLLGIFSRKR